MPETTAPARLHLIYASAANGVIGKDNQLPWRLPEDLAHLKRTTPTNSPATTWTTPRT